MSETDVQRTAETQAEATAPSLMERVNALAEEQIELCYHCHKCTAGCPVAEEMRYGPDQVLLLVQLGQAERLLSSRDIWLCAGCEACATRCPNEIDIARVMDALRQIGQAQGVRAADPGTVKFHRLFLFVVERLGRMNEAGLLGGHKIWTGNLFGDLGSGAQMILKGKIPIVPHAVKGREQLRRIFDAAAARADGPRGAGRQGE
jgi:heterodisulfide reductase subunit C2